MGPSDVLGVHGPNGSLHTRVRLWKDSEENVLLLSVDPARRWQVLVAVFLVQLTRVEYPHAGTPRHRSQLVTIGPMDLI